MMNLERYNRQIILPDFGISSQEKLLNSSVLVVGSGGLGCPALQILVSSGIGKIGIVDFDVVEIQNLHRQFLFDEKDIGFPKVIVAEKHLKNRNSETEIEIFNEKITTKNVIHLIENYEMLLCLEFRYLIQILLIPIQYQKNYLYSTSLLLQFLL